MHIRPCYTGDCCSGTVPNVSRVIVSLLRSGENSACSSSSRSSNSSSAASYLCDRARTVFVCLLRDVTRLRQQEEALQTGRQRVLELADAITEKQLHVVHEIAGLLGETAVETQSAMQELKQAILPVREDRNG